MHRISRRAALALGGGGLATAAGLGVFHYSVPGAAAKPAPIPLDRPFRFPEAEHGGGKLAYVGDVPVVHVRGTPEEIGAQLGVLAVAPGRRLLSYPRESLRYWSVEFLWPSFISMGKDLLERFPADHRAEWEAIVRSSGQGREELIAGNTLFDVKKSFACSAIGVEASRTGAAGPWLARNLDFETLGYLHHYTLVTVYEPRGKLRWASVGFPGLLGCLSGMNEAGLCIAVLECGEARGESTKFTSKGVPYALCIRLLLEQCRTIPEAKALLEKTPRTTMVSFAICDSKQAAVLEVTPKSVELRPSDDGLVLATNHFRSEKLKIDATCWRYDKLELMLAAPRIDAALVSRALHRVNQGEVTLQTMRFAPAEKELHLAYGRLPSSALPMVRIPLKEFLGG